MKRLLTLLAVLALMGLSVASVAAQTPPSQAPVDPQEGCDYYQETGHNLCGVFQAYWAANGGLPVFGYPITEAFEEENWDTGEVYLVQYFERERMEHHTALAGTEYEVLLGRLGNEVLLKQGRDWLDFEKGDSSADHYMPETGFAIAPEFWDYWRSHGLDLGDEGLSFRESLALFGYPISNAEMETNADGDTVLTQWFERARFEFHPDNPAEYQVLLGRLGVEILAEEEPPPPPEPDFSVVVDGLNNPRHVSVGPDGALYVAVAGLGGDECAVVGEDPESGEEFEFCFGLSGSILRIADGETEEIATGLPSFLAGEEAIGVHDVAVTASGEIYAVTGWGLEVHPDVRAQVGGIAESMGLLIQINDDGTWTEVADIAQYEADANPEPRLVDSNPYSLLVDGENIIVVDAGGNTLLQVTPEGDISTLAVFPPHMVLAPPFLGLPEGTEIPADAVPTSVVKGPDGAYYVGELTGFPFALDIARVWRVMPGEDPEVLTTGFTNISDIAFDGAGNLYVLEMLAGGLLNANPEDPSTLAAAITRVAPDGTETTVATAGLAFSTGMTITDDGSIYANNLSVVPGMGQIVLLDEKAEAAAGPELVLTTVAEGLDFPLHNSTGADGAVYVAESGTAEDECVVVDVDPETGEEFEACFGLGGAITRINADGTSEQIVTGLPGVSDVHVTDDGDMYVVFGLGGNPETRAMFESIEAIALGTLAQVHEDGTWEIIADLAQYEADENPDPATVDSNPYALTMDGDNFIVVDAGGNDLLQVTPDGEITTLAVFPPQMVLAPPFLELPEGTEIPQESVPTDVVVGPDGAYYVTELTGFPGTLDTARIWRVTADGDAEVFADGFTALGALDFDDEGNLYVLEIASGGWLAAEMAGEEDPEAAASAVYMIAPDGTESLFLDEGIYFATGLTIGGDGNIYIVNMTPTPNAHVVRVEWATAE